MPMDSLARPSTTPITKSWGYDDNVVVADDDDVADADDICGFTLPRLHDAHNKIGLEYDSHCNTVGVATRFVLSIQLSVE